MNKKIFYHTQESRPKRLTAPIECTRHDAWLGKAFYFWLDMIDADHWGNKSKKRYKYYEVYESEIDCENVLNTVFNEEHYEFWYRQIEKVAKTITQKTKIKPTLKQLNDYLIDKVWEVTGILFQDLPISEHSAIQPITYENGKRMIFAYRKRIQLAVYDINIIHTFAYHKREQCI